MIKKFKTIRNLAVFQNFEWDQSVMDKDGNPQEFKEINIFYGRNYSGKTTISRILRAIENGKLSDKYENPYFSILFSDSKEIKQDNLIGHGKKIRVFNEDFIRENLKFTIDPDEGVNSFAILGEENSKIEEEITKIQKEIGSNEEGKETGLYEKLKNQNEILESASRNLQEEVKDLDKKLNDKATDRTNGIKYNSDKFGDQNYSKPKLERDIEMILSEEYKPISKDEHDKLDKLRNENLNNNIPELFTSLPNMKSICLETKNLLEEKVGKSDKIEDLMKDALLNKWVKDGRQYHKDSKKNKCSFCGNKINENRWIQLDKHFDEESEKLENAIDELIEKINSEIESIKNGFEVNKELFYSKFLEEVDNLLIYYKNVSGMYIEQLNKLKTQLKTRKDDIFNPMAYISVKDFSKELIDIYEKFEEIRNKSNDYS